MQLDGGSAADAQNSCNHYSHERSFYFLAHDSPSFLMKAFEVVLRHLLSPLGCNEPAYARGGARVVEDASAAQNVGAGCRPGTEMVLAGCVLNNQRQLAGRNRSRTKHGGGHRRKNNVLDYPTHRLSSLIQTSLSRRS
jgi:hypothetical protein